MITKKVKEQNVRQMLLSLGVQPFLAEMAIPFVWFLPSTTDPDSASVIEIIKALQRGLNRAGYSLPVNGILNTKTAHALDKVSPGWHEKSFIQIIGDVITAYQNPDSVLGPESPSVALDGYFMYEGAAPGPLPGWMVGTPPGPLGDTFNDGGVMLEFGTGTRNMSNIVPIPKTSGATYVVFKDLQRVINRLLYKMKPGANIAEDAIIGNGTLKAYNQVADQSIGSSFELAAQASSLWAALVEKADRMGIPYGANKGSAISAASIAEMTTGKAFRPKTGIGFFWLLAGAAGLAWFASNKKKKRK